MFDCTCNTQNSLLLNQHNGDDAPQDLNYLPVNGSEGTTRVIGKESVEGTGSSVKGREGKTGLT